MSKTPAVPFALALSDDVAIESILTDIPFFCVGLMTFSIFTFVLVMKRVNLIAIFLYTSSFLAFLAAIFDLSQILAQGSSIAANVSPVSGLIIAREVVLAASLGFLYLFLWCFVAQCPRGEGPMAINELNPRENAHSASWKRWGIIGLLLKWSLLGLCLSITALQIIWRVSPPDSRFGVVYVAEATIEVVVSALFILKLFLNIFLSPLMPWHRPVQSYAAPLVALLISGGLGIGNLIALAFSETPLGRFLRAVEVYILTLFVLIVAFYKVPERRTVLDPQNTREIAFPEPSEKPRASVFHLSSPTTKTLDIASNGRTSPGQNKGTMLPTRTPTISRLSSWIMPRNSRQPDAEEQAGKDTQLVSTPAPAERSSIRNALENPAGPMIMWSNEVWTPTDRQFATASIASYYNMQHSSTISYPVPLNALARETDSPVYGLNGIIERERIQGLRLRPQDSINSFDELLRQQTELDNSIAALRLVSPSTQSTPPDPPEASSSSPISVPGKSSEDSMKARSNSVSTLSYLGRKPDSASNRSDFSLSIFPEPPVVATDTTTRRDELSKLGVRSRAPGLDSPLKPAPIKVTAGEISSLPVSPSRFETTARFDSAGTQYDVTSFIGGLTMPTSSAVQTGVLNNSTTLSDVESEDEFIYTVTPATATTVQGIRPMILGSGVAIPESSSTMGPATASSGGIIGEPSETMVKREASIPLRPFLIGTSSVVSRTGSKVAIGGRRGLPSTPRRPTISGPTIAPDSRGDDAPGAFERPRPPPLRFVS